LPFASALPFERPPVPAFVLQPPASYAEYLKSERWAELSAERRRGAGKAGSLIKPNCCFLVRCPMVAEASARTRGHTLGRY
jgi:hypothetical protein